MRNNAHEIEYFLKYYPLADQQKEYLNKHLLYIDLDELKHTLKQYKTVTAKLIMKHCKEARSNKGQTKEYCGKCEQGYLNLLDLEKYHHLEESYNLGILKTMFGAMIKCSCQDKFILSGYFKKLAEKSYSDPKCFELGYIMLWDTACYLNDSFVKFAGFDPVNYFGLGNDIYEFPVISTAEYYSDLVIENDQKNVYFDKNEVMKKF